MLYAILTEWNKAHFDGTTITYKNVSELALAVWKLSPSEDFSGAITTPDGINVKVAVDREFVYFRYGKYDLGYQLTKDKAIRLPF